MVVRHHRIFGQGLGREKDTRKSIVVLDGNRVELMVMAPRAPQSHPHEGAAGRIKLLINNIPPHLVGVIAGQHLRTDREKTQARDLVPPLLQRFMR